MGFKRVQILIQQCLRAGLSIARMSFMRLAGSFDCFCLPPLWLGTKFVHRCDCRREQSQKEYDERQAERKKREAEMAGEPFHEQV